MTGVFSQSPPDAASPGPLKYSRSGLAMLFFWLLWGDFCFMLMESVVPTLVPLKFQQLGASNATVGLVLTTLPMGMTIVLNPIISFKSDRYRSRFGRRIPFLLVTLPPLVICLCLIGFADRLGLWVHRHFLAWHSISLSASACAVVAVAIAVTVFSFFNTVVNAVFWYLFNDVVPELMLARFMSWFRAVSTVAITVYNLFIFKYAGQHMSAMFVGAGLIYLLGFGAMCLFVKEGAYPPPPKNVDHGTGVISSIKTYGKECHSHGHYRNVFMIGVGFGLLYAGNAFTLYHLQATGLDLDGIGKIRGATGVATFFVVLVSGWLADRFHPLRVTIAGLMLQAFVATPATLLWLFFNPTPHQSYVIWMVISLCLTAPAGAMFGMLDPTAMDAASSRAIGSGNSVRQTHCGDVFVHGRWPAAGCLPRSAYKTSGIANCVSLSPALAAAQLPHHAFLQPAAISELEASGRGQTLPPAAPDFPW